MNQNLSSTADASVKEVKLPISIKVIMIDLDGTLLDTADDLALAANLMLKDLGLPEQSTSTIRSYIGKE